MPSKDTPAAKGARPAALLFELENLCYQGRRVAFDVLKSVLADKDIALTPIAFARTCVDRPIEEGLPALLQLLGRPRLSAEKLVPEITEGIRLSLTENAPPPDAGAQALLAAALDKGYPVGAMTDLDKDAAGAMLARLELDEAATALSTSPVDEANTTTPRAWARLGRSLRAPVPACVAVTTSAATCRAALAAGVRCAVVTDPFTAFQDFGGADAVYDQLDQDAAAGITAMLDQRA